VHLVTSSCQRSRPDKEQPITFLDRSLGRAAPKPLAGCNRPGHTIGPAA
jgi:hypothetical protein